MKRTPFACCFLYIVIVCAVLAWLCSLVWQQAPEHGRETFGLVVCGIGFVFAIALATERK